MPKKYVRRQIEHASLQTQICSYQNSAYINAEIEKIPEILEVDRK